MEENALRWPDGGTATVPYWAYTDPDIYARELDRVWYGPHWLYAGLEAEIPEPGCYKTTWLGERSVIVVRGKDGGVAVLENRCAHRGVRLCQGRFGKEKSFTCPYHQWNYGLDGALQGIPFRRGVRGMGGMPEGFDMRAHRLAPLKVETVNGVIWASFSPDTPSFRDYIGERMWRHYTRIFSNRALRIVGYNRQTIGSNWKLMIENIKDPYHAALLHVFFATFGLFRPDQKTAIEVDDTGGHACLMSVMPAPGSGQAGGEVVGSLPGFDSKLGLKDRRLIEAVKELEGEETVGASTIFPSVILLQQVNSLQTRQIIPRGPDRFELVWTHFGYADDDEEMRERRVRHANLFGPAGLVSADDSEVVEMAQAGFAAAEGSGHTLMYMGRDAAERRDDNMATESAIRAMYEHYRKVMAL